MTTGNDRFGLAAALAEGRALTAAGRIAEAEALLEAVGGAVGPATTALRELALNALRRGDRESATHFLRRTLALAPDDWVSWANLGVALRGLGRPAEAVEAHDQALRLNPKSALAWANRGNALTDLARYADALASFESAVAAAPESAEGHIGRARALINLSRGEEALTALDRAEALKGPTIDTLYLRGHAFNSLSRAAEALAACEAALAIQPDHPLAEAGRAQALLELYFTGEDPPSIDAVDAAFDRALALDPASAELRYSRGLMRLRRHRFDSGWPDFDRRWDVPRFIDRSHGQMKPELLARMSRGLSAADLDGRRVLLVSEQGVGDDMMFASMIPDLLARAAEVSLICERRLHRLFGHAFPAVRIIAPLAEGGVVPPCDLVIPLGGLGALFRTRGEDFPGTPYLAPTDTARARWADWLGPRDGLRVGLSWRGGAKSTGGDLRSIDLDRLLPVLTTPGCEFVNLQYGAAARDADAISARLPRPIRSPGAAEIDDFDDLAGLVAGLDLVVSVQTALVHLCGATGAPCLAMLPAKPEWRYGATDETIPWYGSVRLVRQGPERSWDPVIARVAAEVARRAQAPQG